MEAMQLYWLVDSSNRDGCDRRSLRQHAGPVHGCTACQSCQAVVYPATGGLMSYELGTYEHHAGAEDEVGI